MRSLFRQHLQRHLDSLPLLDDASLSKRALVVSPHQDDETLGCGGFILRKVYSGADVRVVFVADGSSSHAAFMDRTELAELRRTEAINACGQLGVDQQRISFLEFPDGRLIDHARQIEDALRSVIDDFEPEQVLLPHRREPPLDHRVVASAAFAAAASASATAEILEYPIWLWHHWPWIPLRISSLFEQLASAHRDRMNALVDCRVDILKYRNAKLAALAEHRTQTTRLGRPSSWPVLSDVAGGDWLRCLTSDSEWFLRTPISRA